MKERIIMEDKGWNLENTYTRLPSLLFTEVELNPVKSPEIIFLNFSLAEELGLNIEKLKEEVEVFAGNKAPDGSIPIAKAYGGHQFGHFTILGDGRALLLGEQITPKGKRVDIELKGSGRTPYSRRGDGRAGIGPMLREYIMSEAMHALKIPTTRGLAVVTTGENIRRETMEKGSILTRVASSHIRVGTFEYIASRGSDKDLKELSDYTINRHFKNIKKDDNPYLSLLKEVIKTQALLISKWQLVGFVHGVMNTDNVSISGETIDYGPCAFMDIYDPETVFSSIDREGRYSYGNQVNITLWNLSRFAETLIPLIDDNKDKAIELCKDELAEFENLYSKHYIEGMRKKLGLFNEEEEDLDLIKELLNLMYKEKLDYTNTFRLLTLYEKGSSELKDLFKKSEFESWYRLWSERLSRQNKTREETRELMKANNPNIIPRNFRVEEAIKAAEDNENYGPTEKLLEALKNPYDYSCKYDEYVKLPPKRDKPYRTYCGT